MGDSRDRELKAWPRILTFIRGQPPAFMLRRSRIQTVSAMLSPETNAPHHADELSNRQSVRGGLTEWAATVLQPLNLTPAAHHRLLLDKLDAVAEGRIDRLMVLMPPGSAKSTYSSIIFPVWWFHRHPASSVIATSHTASLAEHFSRQVRGLVGQHGKTLGIKVRSDDRSAARWRLATGGQYFATGLRGTVTGRRGDLIIIDDPVKSQTEAESSLARELSWNWYRSDLLTRLTPGGRVILVMTRWHEDDLGGRLLAQDNAGWNVLRLPALAEADDPLQRPVGAPLWPEWEDASALLRKRETIGERAWSSLFQQAPRPQEGALFKADRVIILDAVPDKLQANPVRAWDFAATAKSNDNDPDWTVGLKMQRDSGGRFIVLDVVRLRGTPMEVEQVLGTTAARDGIAVTIALPQDPGSAGKSLASNYIRNLAGFHVAATPETGSKVVRATPLAAQVEGGNLAIVRADWNFAFLEELRDFPLGRKDDQVDALSRAFGHLLNDCAPARKLQLNFLAR